MRLIIDIPKEKYKLICSDGRPFLPSYKWIKNGIPLDKIRAEIEGLTYYWCEVNPKSVIDDVLQIIDKYRESEE